ncbi:uncharacterized protein METZ01_LOCUS302992, partial [marine metagenome]
KKIYNKLWELLEGRGGAAHIPKGLKMNKPSGISKEELNYYKGLFILVHMKSLHKIKKSYPDYGRVKEV